MLKTLRVKECTHKELKEFCDSRNKKIVGTIDQLIIEAIRVIKIKEVI